MPWEARGQEAQEKVTFDDHVQPIFRQRCASCHNPDKKSGGLDLTNFTALMLGGSSGEAIDPGDADGSYLYMLITHEQEPVMPPNSTKLPTEELRTIRKWINEGALETASSKANIKKKKTPDLTASASPLERPELVAYPPRLPLEPVVKSEQSPTAVPLAISPWAPVVAVGGARQVLLYDTNSLALLGVLPFPEGRPHVLRFSRNGHILLAGGGTDAMLGKVVLWDVRTGRRVAEIGDELDVVLTADISSDHRLVALGGPQKVVRVFRVATGELLYERRKHTDWVTSVSFSPDGVLLATGDRGGNVFVWEAETGNEYLTLRGHTQLIHELTWRLDSNVLVSVSEDTTLRMWEMENGGQIKSITGHGGGATWGVFTREGSFVSAGRDHLVKLWNSNGDMQTQFPGLNDVATFCAYCNESQRIVGGDWRGNVLVWQASNGELVGSLAANPPGLANRLELAQAELTVSDEQLSRAEAAFQETNGRFEMARQTLAAAVDEQHKQQAILADREQTLQTKRTVIETKMAEQVAWQTELLEKQSLLPNLESLVSKAKEVAEMSNLDAELRTAAEQLADNRFSRSWRCRSRRLSNNWKRIEAHYSK